MSNVSFTGNTPILPNTLTVPDPNAVTPSNTGATQVVLPPVSSYLALPFARMTFEMLGISLPRTPDDAAAVLAEVSLLLEQTVAQTRSNRDVIISENMRSAFIGLGGIIGTMQGLSDHYIALKVELEEKTAQRQQKIEQRAHNEQRISQLGGQLTTNGQQIQGLQTTAQQLDASLTSINQQIDQHSTSNPTLANELRAQRDNVLIPQRNGVTGQLAGAVAERANMTSEAAALQAQNTQLTNDINTLTQQINNIANEMEVTRQAYFETQMIMMYLFVPLSVFLMSRMPINILFAAHHDLVVARVFDDIMDRLRVARDPVIGRFEALAQLERIATINIAVRASLALNMAIGGNLFDSFAGRIVLGRILDAAITDLALARFDPTGFHMARFLDRVVNDMALLGHPLMHPFDAMMLMDRMRLADSLVVAALGLGIGFNNFMANPFLMNVFDSALVALGQDLFSVFRNDMILGHALLAAAGLVGGLGDVLSTLALLQTLDALNIAESALTDGLRLRLAI